MNKTNFNGKRIWKGKHGEDMLIDFWAIIVFAIVLLLFFLLFSANNRINDKQVQAEYINKDVNFMLESFLRAPAIGVDSSKTVGEIIAEDSIKDDYKTEDLFNRYFKYINKMNDQNIIEINLQIKADYTKNIPPIEKNKKTGTVSESYSETYIPGYNSRIYVRLGIWGLYKPT